MRTNRRQGEHVGRRENYAAARRQIIGGRACGRADDQTVAAIARQRLAIHPHIQLDQPRSPTPAQDDVIERGLVDLLAPGAARRLQQNARFKIELTVPDARQGWRQFLRRNRGQEPQAADIDAENRRARAGGFPRDAQHGAVTAEHEQQVHFPRQGGGVGANDRIKSRKLRGSRVAVKLAPGGGDEPSGLADRPGARGLVRISNNADSFDFVSQRFQSAPEIPYYRPAQAPATP